MNITTKFEIGQKVWFKKDDKSPFEGHICSITIDIDIATGVTIEYWTKGWVGKSMIFDESETFATKEEAME